MALVKVRRKYQITLPRETRKYVRIGEKVEVVPVGNEIIIRRKPKPRKNSSLKGLGKDLWRTVDALEYVDGLRSEWEPREPSK